MRKLSIKALQEQSMAKDLYQNFSAFLPFTDRETFLIETFIYDHGNYQEVTNKLADTQFAKIGYVRVRTLIHKCIRRLMLQRRKIEEADLDEKCFEPIAQYLYDSGKVKPIAYVKATLNTGE